MLFLNLTLRRVRKILSNTKSRPKRLRSLFSKYDHLFQGIGKIPDYKVHLHIDKTVQPFKKLAEFRLP